MSKPTLFAWTEPNKTYPAYINIELTGAGNVVRVLVRSTQTECNDGVGLGSVAAIEIPTSACQEMFGSDCHQLQRELAAVTQERDQAYRAGLEAAAKICEETPSRIVHVRADDVMGAGGVICKTCAKNILAARKP